MRAGKIMALLSEKLTYLTLRLAQKIVGEKLSGQVLHHRSGKLIGSVHITPVEIVGTTISAGVESSAGPAWYGKVHERGGLKAYIIKPVNKKALAFFTSGKNMFNDSGLAGTSRGKDIMRKLRSGSQTGKRQFMAGGGVVVKSVMHPPLPKRPFMAPSLEEMREEIIRELQFTIMRGLRGTA